MAKFSYSGHSVRKETLKCQWEFSMNLFQLPCLLCGKCEKNREGRMEFKVRFKLKEKSFWKMYLAHQMPQTITKVLSECQIEIRIARYLLTFPWGAFTYDVRCFLGNFDLPTYPIRPNQILYYISLFSKIRCSLAYLPT